VAEPIEAAAEGAFSGGLAILGTFSQWMAGDPLPLGIELAGNAMPFRIARGDSGQEFLGSAAESVFTDFLARITDGKYKTPCDKG